MRNKSGYPNAYAVFPGYRDALIVLRILRFMKNDKHSGACFDSWDCFHYFSLEARKCKLHRSCSIVEHLSHEMMEHFLV